MIPPFRPGTATSDEGFSLAELAVYAMMSTVALVIVSSIFISSIRVREQVTDLNRTASVGQLIASSVEEGVRNASGPPSATIDTQRWGIQAEPITATGHLLRARVAVGAADGSILWQCQAWFFSPETGAVYSATNNTQLIENPIGFTVSNSIHTATAGSDHWTLLGEGVRLSDDESQFFSTSSDSVQLRFEVATENVSLVLIPSTVVRRTLAAGGTGPTTCY